jgi:hypothetical protein
MESLLQEIKQLERFMDIMSVVLMYIVIALSASITSYITIYRPAINLLEEIVERKTLYSGLIGSSIWIILTTIAFPWNINILLKNDNDLFIERFAVELAERMDNTDE